MPASLPSPSQGVWFLGPVPVRAYALLIIVGIVVDIVLLGALALLGAFGT